MAGFEEVLFEQMYANEKEIGALRERLERANMIVARVRGLIRGMTSLHETPDTEEELWRAIEASDMDTAADILLEVISQSK